MDWDELGDALEHICGEPNRDRRLSEYRLLLDEVGPGEDGRAETLAHIAEEQLAEGSLDEAEATYREAIEDGGRTVLTPYVGLLDISLERADDAAADEWLKQLLTMSRNDLLVVGDYEWIAETLEDAGRLRAALRWFTIPLRDIQPGDIDLMPVVCLVGRYRVRRKLDLPIDAYDEAHDVWREVTEQV